MKAILALNQGTTSSRAIVFHHDGSIRAVAQQEFQQIFPKAGWVEHNPNEIWKTQLDTARAALEKVGLTAGDVAAVGITNQRETNVLWDRRTGEPIHNAIVWQDRRTSGFCDQLKAAGHTELVQQRAGLVIRLPRKQNVCPAPPGIMWALSPRNCDFRRQFHWLEAESRPCAWN